MVRRLWFFILAAGFAVSGYAVYSSQTMMMNQVGFIYAYLLLSLIIVELSPEVTFSFEVGVLALVATGYGPVWTLVTAFSGGLMKGIYEQFRVKKPVKVIIIDFSIQGIATLLAGYTVFLCRRLTGVSAYLLVITFLLIFFTVSLFLKVLFRPASLSGSVFSAFWFSVKQNILAIAGISLASLIAAVALEKNPYNLFILVFCFLLYLQYLLTGLAKEYRRNLELSQLLINTLQSDLDEVHDMCAKMLPSPEQNLPGLQVRCFNLSAKEIGGDFYDFITLNDSVSAFLIGDVMGHGIKAAIQMNTALTGIHAILNWTLSPAGCLTELNQVSLPYLVRTKQYYTVFLGIYNSFQKVLYFANAGHLPPVLVRKRTGQAEFLRGKGTAIGFQRSPRCEECSYPLETGDLLLLYTDGLAEMIAGSRSGTSIQKVLEFMQEQAEKPDLFEILEEQVYKPLTDSGEKDDITFFLVTVQ